MIKLFFLLITALFLASCDSGTVNKGGVDGNAEMMGDPVYSEKRDSLEANGSITFEGKEPLCFSFNQGKTVECDTSAEWDLKFEDWFIFTNGGISGKHAGGGVYMKADHYDEITAVNVPGMVFTDNYGSVFDNWYDADMTDTFTISTKGFVYLVKKEKKVYKISIVSYYGEAQGSPVSAVYAIKFADLDTPEKVQTVENINATAGGTEAKGDGAYLSFENGILDLTDKAAADSTEWDMKFKRYNINLNSGVSGSGKVSGVKLSTKDFDTVSSADIPEEEAFEEDRVRPVIDRWAVFKDGKLLYPDFYYIIRTGNGRNWFKFYPLEVTEPAENGYSSLKFRFDKLK